MEKFIGANDFFVRMYKTYKQVSIKSELIFDIGIPFLIAALVLYTIDPVETGTKQLLSGFKQIFGSVIDVLAILAGFSMTSISMIASSNSEAVVKLKSDYLDCAPSTSVFTALVSLFSWSVLFQFLTIMYSVVLYVLFTFMSAKANNVHSLWLIVGLIFIWFAMALYSLLVAVRNMKTVHYFIISNKSK